MLQVMCKKGFGLPISLMNRMITGHVKTTIQPTIRPRGSAGPEFQAFNCLGRGKSGSAGRTNCVHDTGTAGPKKKL